MCSHSSSHIPTSFSHGFNAHWQTIYPHLQRSFRSLYRPNKGLLAHLKSSDGDVIPYLQWTDHSRPENQKDLVILSHGLEGAATSDYNLEAAATLHQQGFDVWAWYMRGCAPEMNPGPLIYNSGFTLDIKCLCEQANKQGYRRLFLIGFSVGGNITLKALGEGLQGVTAAVAYSSPLVLGDVSDHLSKNFDGFYMKRFLKSLKEKIIKKEVQYPGSMPVNKLSACRDFYSFDDHFTAPMHHFTSAKDYYDQSSSIHFLSSIKTPAKLISATNDPFLTPSCFPDPAAHPNMQFYYPDHGGHCGFGHGKESMAEMALDFFRQMTNFDR
ncbi:MAG: putative hydrolase of the alpha/beta-hydrolase fold protein [Chitinophagaceae bacterium]|nr:putative hydrolase of the alpha/beta-hydrolase fold protein [Chitinophagaceae bacterium]